MVGPSRNAEIYTQFHVGNARPQKTFTADEIEEHLHEKNMPLLVENGGMCLRSLQGM